MEAICCGIIALMVLSTIVAIVQAAEEREERARYESGQMTWTEELEYLTKQERKRLERIREARAMRDLGMFFILADLADGDLDGSFFFIDGDK